jgi:ubiquinone/menaquinone biosynthesis C-methylase UbiE
MSAEQDQRRERAFHFDLFVSTGWTERFDQIVAEHVDLPDEGRLLEINCGTGDHVIAVAANLKTGEVIGTDIDSERLNLARAKALVAKSEHCSFVEADPLHLGFVDNSFAGVVLDASLEPPGSLAALAVEAMRVASREATVAIKVQAGGSFDEYYSVLWEALHDVGIADEVWTRLEPIVTSRPSVADAVGEIRSAGLRHAEHHSTKEEWRFESTRELLDSPLARMLFLEASLALVPDSRREAVIEALERILDREMDGQYFSVSAKALVVAGQKS